MATLGVRTESEPLDEAPWIALASGSHSYDLGPGAHTCIPRSLTSSAAQGTKGGPRVRSYPRQRRAPDG